MIIFKTKSCPLWLPSGGSQSDILITAVRLLQYNYYCSGIELDDCRMVVEVVHVNQVPCPYAIDFLVRL